MKQMNFGNGESVKVNSQLIFDTGTSYVIVPLNDFNIIKKNVIDPISADCRFTPNLQLICKCESSSVFPHVKLVIDSASGISEFIINFEDIIDYYPFLEYQCRFQMVLDIQLFTNIWILGDSLLRNTLISFDMQKRQIGYVQNINLYEKNIVESTVKGEVTRSESSDMWFYIVILLAVLLLFIFIYKCFTGRGKNEDMSGADYRALDDEKGNTLHNQLEEYQPFQAKKDSQGKMKSISSFYKQRVEEK